MARKRKNETPVAAPEPKELGLSGSYIVSGRIHSESNTKLQWEKAYGYATGSQWGEWELLHRTDPAIAAALGLLVAPLRDAQVEFDADADTPEEITEFLRDALLEWTEPQWAALLEQVVTYGVGYGFSLHELVWGVRSDSRIPGGQAWYIKKFAQRLPNSIQADGWIIENGELAAIKQTGVKDGRWQTGLVLPADKTLLCTWNKTGNNYQGFSAFRPIWYLAKLRAELLKILAIGHQREALGIPTATVSENAPPLSDEQRESLQEFLENLVYHENAAVQLPPGVNFEWVFSPGANKSNVLETWRQLGVAILEVVHAQQVALGTGETGSRSVGEVHNANKNAFVEGIRAWVESCFNGVGEQAYTGIVKKIVDLNFGPQDKYPKLKLVTPKGEMDPISLAGAIRTLSDAGALTLTDNDEDDIRARLGLRPIDPAERTRIKEEKAAVAKNIQSALSLDPEQEEEEAPE